MTDFQPALPPTFAPSALGCPGNQRGAAGRFQKGTPMDQQVITCEVFPRTDSTPDDLKALGDALARWHDQSMDEDGYIGVVFFYDAQGMKDLRKGEFPQPRGLQSVSLMRKASKLLGMKKPDVSMREATEALGSKRTIFMHAERSEDYNREELVNSLRTAIPAHLVSDIQIDGQSWNEEQP
jgi:hypothetical protein